MFGDLKTIMDIKMDRSQVTTTPVLQRQVWDLFQELELRDIWRERHLTDRDYTYYSVRFQTHSRLDMFLDTTMIYNKVLSVDIEP